jgi:tRNA 2-thiouridine synthesizing protein D
MIYSICVTSPLLSSGHRSAQKFCQAVLDQGHHINQLFFYQDAVHVASTLLAPAQNEQQTQQGWLKLKQQGAPLTVCVAAAIRRGILDQQQAQRYEKDKANLHEAFDIVGLGEFISLAEQADKQVSFG